MAIVLIAIEDRMARKWAGRKVLTYAGLADEIRAKIPCFTRDDFRTKEAKNKYLDVIIRKPLKDPQGKMLPDDDESHIPVATVSKTYGLLQHLELFEVLKRALGYIVFDPQSLEAELMVTEYGERMRVSFLLHHCEFNPGDGYPMVLKVNALNSVDGRASLGIDMTWYRPVSGTSLMYQMSKKLKKRHVKTLDPQLIEEFLVQQLNRLRGEHNLYSEWYQTRRSRYQVEHWIAETVAEKWGRKASNRVHRISRDGWDAGNVEVPEIFAPVQNLYHLSQVLSWVAKWAVTPRKKESDQPQLLDDSQQEGAEETEDKPNLLQQRPLGNQLKMMMEIPTLMDDLVEMEESPTQIEF